MTHIQETKNYTLSVAVPVNTKEAGDSTVYQIKNKKYGVVELETVVLPQAIKFLHDLEAGLAAVEDMYSTKEDEIVPIHPGKSRILN